MSQFPELDTKVDQMSDVSLSTFVNRLSFPDFLILVSLLKDQTQQGITFENGAIERIVFAFLNRNVDYLHDFVVKHIVSVVFGEKIIKSREEVVLLGNNVSGRKDIFF